MICVFANICIQICFSYRFQFEIVQCRNLLLTACNEINLNDVMITSVIIITAFINNNTTKRKKPIDLWTFHRKDAKTRVYIFFFRFFKLVYIQNLDDFLKREIHNNETTANISKKKTESTLKLVLLTFYRNVELNKLFLNIYMLRKQHCERIAVNIYT